MLWSFWVSTFKMASLLNTFYGEKGRMYYVYADKTYKCQMHLLNLYMANKPNRGMHRYKKEHLHIRQHSIVHSS